MGDLALTVGPSQQGIQTALSSLGRTLFVPHILHPAVRFSAGPQANRDREGHGRMLCRPLTDGLRG